jgi:DNA-binding transcriptional regulator YiaG
MTANQYRAAIKSLRLSQAKAALFLGVSLRASQGWALGENPVPVAVAKLLRLMIRLHITPEDCR